MFIADRDAKCSRLRRSRAGHAALSHRQTTSSASRCRTLPHTGHAVGIVQGALRGAPSTTIDFTTLE